MQKNKNIVINMYKILYVITNVGDFDKNIFRFGLCVSQQYLDYRLKKYNEKKIDKYITILTIKIYSHETLFLRLIFTLLTKNKIPFRHLKNGLKCVYCISSKQALLVQIYNSVYLCKKILSDKKKYSKYL